jgi:hypothetical protein
MSRLKFLQKEEEVMSLSFYYEDSEACDARSILKMEVETCSKAILALCLRHGKSPCFSGVTFLQLFSPDYPVLVLPCVDGAKNMECAFCHGNR